VLPTPDIRDTYHACRDLILDTPDVIEEVERYRQDCKPEVVKTVLLAESHSHTPEKEFSQFLKKECLHDDGSRCRLVRFVYCLGASESQVLEYPEAARHRPWQFWRVLYSCKHQIKATSDFISFDGVSSEQRLKNKLELLDDLKASGVWLVDASVVGINGLNRDARIEIMQTCWQGYVGQELRELKSLKKIVVVGDTVYRALSKELKELGVEIGQVPQPQKRVEGGYVPYYQKIFKFCNCN